MLGFPQVSGAIDGTHVPIVAPQESTADFYNQKGYCSVVVQAVVDHRSLFTDVYIGWPGKVHNAHMLANVYRKR